jgi:hypothetical protein
LTAIVQVLIKEVERGLCFGHVVAVGECGDMRVIKKEFQLALHGEIMPEMR